MIILYKIFGEGICSAGNYSDITTLVMHMSGLVFCVQNIFLHLLYLFYLFVHFFFVFFFVFLMSVIGFKRFALVVVFWT